MDKILLIDKPKGITSYDVIRKLKPQFPKGTKIGHAGTLDPLASGLMILGLGKATKRLSEFLKLPKRYEVEAVFGKISLTYDSEGPFTDGGSEKIDRTVIEKIIAEKFLGQISQIPPAFSAAHVNGRRAYDLARKGEKVELAAREVVIQSFEILAYEWPKVKFDVRCSSGTYIRSLVHDLGQVLGCGAYVSELRRTEIGDYTVAKASSLENIRVDD